MPTKIIFTTIGAFVLTFAAYWNTNAARNFRAAATSAFFRKGAATPIITLFRGAAGSNLTTVKRVGYVTAFWQTAGGGLVTLFGVKSGTTLVRTLFRPAGQ